MTEQKFLEVDNVSLEISIDIIEHFSKNLYRSPYKAIEELVTNGYDALAREVKVYLPGFSSISSIIVWDDGESMDVKGIKDLWHIAASPKANSSRILTSKDGCKRKVIGKFGIGKLASYSLGKIITHLCKKNNSFLLISVNYDDLKKDLRTDGINAEANKNGYTQTIYKLSEKEARQLIIGNLAININLDMFNKESWTCAIISELKPNKITQGLLKRVLGRSMPLKPDFKIFLNDIELTSLLLVSDALEIYDLGNENFVERLKKSWVDYKTKSGNESELVFKKEKVNGVSTAIVEFPNLGKVHGHLRLSNSTLHDGKAAKVDRMFGYFVYVRDRLINPEDDKLFLSYPSFASFYRSQIIIHADNLDDVLLADRERFSDNDKIEEFKILQDVCYKTLNERWKKESEKIESVKEYKNRIPIHQKELFSDPVRLLWMKKVQNDSEVPRTLDFDIENPTIERASNGVDSNVSTLDLDSDKPRLIINDDHPFYKRQQRIAGNTKVAKSIVREIENMIIMETMFEGYLHFLEIEDIKVDSIVRWRENMYRQLAVIDNSTIAGAIEELKDASYKGDRDFEIAISNLLGFIGFKSEVKGLSGNPDIVAKAVIGEESYTLVFEAKGSKDILPNTKAAVSAAVSHAKNSEAEHAVIVARDYAGFSKSGEPAILQECRSINNNEKQFEHTSDSKNGNVYLRMKEKSNFPTVSIMTVENLIDLALAVNRFQYDLDLIKDIFTTIETPKEKADRISKLNRPSEGFDFAGLLNIIYEEQNIFDESPFASLSQIWRKYYSNGEKGVTNKTQLKLKFEALQSMAFPYIPYNDDDISLTTTPEIIIKRIRTRMDEFDTENA